MVCHSWHLLPERLSVYEDGKTLWRKMTNFKHLVETVRYSLPPARYPSRKKRPVTERKPPNRKNIDHRAGIPWERVCLPSYFGTASRSLCVWTTDSLAKARTTTCRGIRSAAEAAKQAGSAAGSAGTAAGEATANAAAAQCKPVWRLAKRRQRIAVGTAAGGPWGCRISLNGVVSPPHAL